MRKRLAAFCLLFVMLCTGCDSGITLTAEENDLIAEYISSVLLKYSKEYHWKYTKLNKAVSTESQSQSGNASQPATESALNPYASSSASQDGTGGEKESTGSNTGDSQDGMRALAAQLGGGVTVSYSTYVIGSEYPAGDIVSVPATSGRKILAVEFSIVNSATSVAVCNGKSNKVVLALKVNGEKEYVQAGTILNYDVANMNNFAIEPGQSAKGVALFMIPETVLNGIERLEITVTAQGQVKGTSVIKK